MAHKISWFVEKRVILLVYDGVVDSNEMQSVNQELEDFFLAGQKPIHMINDDTSVTKLNTNINTIVKTFSVLSLDGWGYIFTIGDSIRTRFLFKTLNLLLKMNNILCPTMEIAIEELYKHDPSLSQKADEV